MVTNGCRSWSEIDLGDRSRPAAFAASLTRALASRRFDGLNFSDVAVPRRSPYGEPNVEQRLRAACLATPECGRGVASLVADRAYRCPRRTARDRAARHVRGALLRQLALGRRFAGRGGAAGALGRHGHLALFRWPLLY